MAYTYNLYENNLIYSYCRGDCKKSEGDCKNSIVEMAYTCNFTGNFDL